MANFCQACGKEIDADKQYCADCEAALASLNETSEAKPAQQQPAQKKKSKGDPKKGRGPAIAALIFAIIAFFTTALVTLIMSAVKGEMEEALAEIISQEVANSGVTKEYLSGFAIGLKIAMGAIHFAGFVPMLVSLILFLVAIVKYYGNDAEDKKVSTIVVAYIALAFLVTAIIFACVGTSGYAEVIDKLMKPFLG